MARVTYKQAENVFARFCDILRAQGVDTSSFSLDHNPVFGEYEVEVKP